MLGPTTALANAVEGLLVIDRAGMCTYANASAGRLFGVPESEVVGTPLSSWRTRAAPGAIDGDGELPAARVLRTGELEAINQHVVDRADGTSSVVIDTATAVHDDHGALEGAVVSLVEVVDGAAAAQRARDAEGVMVIDVSEHKRVQRELDGSVSLLRATLESTADGLLVVDDRGHISAYNDKFVQMWRIPRSIMEAGDDQRALAFVLDQLRDPAKFIRRTTALYSDAEASSDDVLELTDGRIYERYSQPQRVAGRCVGRVWSFRDVSERCRAEAERETLLAEQVEARHRMEALAAVAQRQAAELQHIHGSMVDSVVVCDAHGRITHVNDAETRLTGVSSDEVLGHTLDEYAKTVALRHLDGAPLTAAELPLARALAGEIVMSAAFWTESSGRRVFMRSNATPIRDAVGMIVGAVSVDRDVSSVIEFDVLKDQFIRVAAHELKTPVAIMKGYADLLLRSSERLSPALNGSLEAIARGANRIDRLVGDLLDVSQLQLGRMEIRREKLDISELVDVVTRRVALTAKKHEIRVVESEPIVVQADGTRLERVLDKLLDNAVRYSPRGGPVRVSVRVRQERAVVCVADRGVGIARDKQGRIFERFYRAHTDTPHDYGGMGVGLYISRAIIEQHGGTMWFRSTEGRGSRFCFSLPVKT